MPVPDTSRSRVYTVGGTPTSVFSVPFYVEEETAVGLIVTEADGTETTPSFTLEQTYGPGFYSLTLDEPVTNVSVTVYSKQGYGFEGEYFSGVPMPAEQVGAHFNRVFVCLQQLRDALARKFGFPDYDAGSGELNFNPVERAGKVLAFDSNGDVELHIPTPADLTAVADGGLARRKIQFMPPGYILGRTSAGTGAVQLLPLEDIQTILGLGNVDNTSDVNKPVSTAQEAAISAVSGEVASLAATLSTVATSGSYNDLEDLPDPDTAGEGLVKTDSVFSVAPTRRFSAYTTAAQSIPSATATRIIFGSEDYDINGEYDHTTGLFTPKTAGWYSFIAAVAIPTGSKYSTRLLKITKNNTPIGRDEFLSHRLDDSVANFQKTAQVMTRPIYFNGSTDWADVTFYHNAGASITLDGNSYSNFFCARREF